MRLKLMPELVAAYVIPCLSCLPAANAQALLADLEPSGPNEGSRPRSFVTMNGITYFAADGVYGNELYRTDGTAAGTSVVKNISLEGSSSPEYLTVVRDTLYFTAFTPETGRELWATDGTAAGTRLVREIRPGPGSSGDGGSPITDLTAFAGFLFFVADDGQTGREVWYSSGTAASTQVFVDIVPGANSSSPRDLKAGSNALWFVADNGMTGEELWVWDTLTAPRLVVDLEPGTAGSVPERLTPFGSALLFSAFTNLGGRELWRTNGSAGSTQIVIDAWPGSGSSSPEDLTIVGTRVFYTCDNGTIGRELWQTDGTTGGSLAVIDLSPRGSVLSWITAYDGNAYFVWHNNAVNGAELWRSDGSPGGTALVRDLWPGLDSSLPTLLTVIASGPTTSGTLCFVANDGVSEREVWAYDPLTGMRLVADIRPGNPSAAEPQPTSREGSIMAAPPRVVSRKS
jgi:ELWxxDGT repeat protein